MRRKHLSFLILSLFCLLLISSIALGKKVTLELRSSDFSKYSVSESSLNNFLVVNFNVPADVIGKRLDAVILEFYVNASLKEGVDEDHIPLIEIYPLTNAYSGVGVPNFSSSSSVRNLKLGESKRAVMDITEIVKNWVTNPTQKHGLIIGSLTGDKSSEFTLRNDAIGGNIAAKITFYYQNRFGGKVSK